MDERVIFLGNYYNNNTEKIDTISEEDAANDISIEIYNSITHVYIMRSEYNFGKVFNEKDLYELKQVLHKAVEFNNLYRYFANTIREKIIFNKDNKEIQSFKPEIQPGIIHFSTNNKKFILMYKDDLLEQFSIMEASPKAAFYTDDDGAIQGLTDGVQRISAKDFENGWINIGNNSLDSRCKEFYKNGVYKPDPSLTIENLDNIINAIKNLGTELFANK